MDKQSLYDLIIIGSGASGMAAGIYAGRYRMKTLVISSQFGGETIFAGKIENYPGFKSVDGFDLMSLMKEQAQDLEVNFVDGTVTEVNRNAHCFSVHAGKEQYLAKAIIFTTGTERRHLGLPDEDKLKSKGVHYCITCDGPLYRNKTIAVVGGGDSSVKGVNLAAEYANKIYLIVKGQKINAEPINYERMKKLGDKVEVLFETQVTELSGLQKLESITLSKPYQGSAKLKLDGLFVEIGATPNAGLAKTLGVELDEKGYIKTDAAMQTNIDGIFAAGDITSHFGSFKQDITAAAMGAVAATSAYEDNKLHGDLCELHKIPVRVAAVKH
jgi:thioredoxin reductase (NADPH)